MTSRLIVNGVPYTFDRHRPLADEYFPQPIGYIHPQTKSFYDGPWGLRYRVIGRHVNLDDWLDMPTMKQLLGRDEKWIAAEVRAGLIDAAVVEGSQIPMFRVADRETILRKAIIAQEPAPKPTGHRPKKERWL
jgi:hypothetical protein